MAVEQEIGRVVGVSRHYASEPWGFRAEQHFWNQVLDVETSLEPEALLEAIHRIEQRLGRDREREQSEKSARGERYASRTMDIDILFYDDRVIDTPSLRIPHPHLADRDFVLRPLCELMPERRHPESGLTMHMLWQALENKRKNEHEDHEQ